MPLPCGGDKWVTSRDIRVRAHGGELWRISDLHPAYDPLYFVLFHAHGEPSWQPGMPHAVVAPIRRRVAGGEEEGDARHVVAYAKPAQPAQDDGSEEEGDAEHVATDARPAQPALHESGLAITCTIRTRHRMPFLCMENVCIKNGVLTNTTKWNHNGCFTYTTTRALDVLQFMVAWLMLLPITTPTLTTWAGSLYCHPHSLVATDTWLNCTKIPWPLSANMASLICSSP